MKFLEKLQDFFGIVPSDIYRVDLQCGNCSYTGRYDIDKGKLKILMNGLYNEAVDMEIQ